MIKTTGDIVMSDAEEILECYKTTVGYSHPKARKKWVDHDELLKLLDEGISAREKQVGQTNSSNSQFLRAFMQEREAIDLGYYRALTYIKQKITLSDESRSNQEEIKFLHEVLDLLSDEKNEDIVYVHVQKRIKELENNNDS